MSAPPNSVTVLPPGTKLTLSRSRGFTTGHRPSLLVSFYLWPKDAITNTPQSNPSETNSPTILVFQAQFVPSLRDNSRHRNSAYTKPTSMDYNQYLSLVNNDTTKPLAQLSSAQFGESPEMSWVKSSLEAKGSKMLHAFACLLQINAKATARRSSIVLVPPGRWDAMTAPGVDQMSNIAHEKTSSKARLQLTAWMKEALADEKRKPSPRDVGVYWQQADGLSIARISAECKGEDGNMACTEPSSEVQDRDTSSRLKCSDGYVGGSEMTTGEGFPYDNNWAMNSAGTPQMLEEDGLVYVLDPRNGGDSVQVDDNLVFDLLSDYLSSKS